MPRIFISYKRVDKDKVFKIKDQIESALGEKCWIDLDGIESDAHFANVILNAIENSSIVLFFYGNDTESSQWQRRELEYARANGKTVIPIILVEIPDDSWYKCYFEKFSVIKYTDDSWTELILKEISNDLKKGCDHSNGQSEECEVKTRGCDAAALSTPTPILATAPPTSTKSCGCGCLIGIFVLLGIFLLLRDGSPAPDQSPIIESSQLSDSIYVPSLDCTSPKEEDMARLPKESTSKSSEKPNPGKGGQGFDERYDTKDLTLLSYVELAIEYDRTKIIEDSLYEIIREEASARYDLQELHRYQLRLREELITRRTNTVEDTIDTTVVEGDEYCQDNVDDYLYNEDSSELPTWMWCAGLIVVISLVIPILLMRKKKRTRNLGKEVLPLFREKKEIKIFIAGSTRLVTEREALRATISKMYNQHKTDNLVVEAYEFDDFTREFVEGGQQKLYDNFIRNEANWVVFITDGTIGDKTIWELENAINVHKETGRPKILMYSIPQNIMDNQKDQMSQFKSILNREDNYWIDYDDVSTIRSTFREHLEWDLINLMKQELRRVG